MLVATRDDGPHAHVVHYGPPAHPRSFAARVTSGAQLIGSLVGIPLALIGGYSTYHVTFSPEAKCQALRANIVSMLDKKADASTLRLLVQRDVVSFERDCGAVDSDAAAAFRTLLAAPKVATAHRAQPAKVEAVVAEPPAKIEKLERAEKNEKHEPIKREAAKHETPIKETAAKESVAKLQPPKQLGAPPHPLAAPPSVAEKAPPPAPTEKFEEIKPAEAAPESQKASVDAAWVASVRDVLRESATKPPAAETTSEVAAPSLASPINISPEPQVASGAAERAGLFAPPAEVGPDGSRPVAPRPPAPIPNAN